MSIQVLPTAPSPTVTHLINFEALIISAANPNNLLKQYLFKHTINTYMYIFESLKLGLKERKKKLSKRRKSKKLKKKRSVDV